MLRSDIFFFLWVGNLSKVILFLAAASIIKEISKTLKKTQFLIIFGIFFILSALALMFASPEQQWLIYISAVSIFIQFAFSLITFVSDLGIILAIWQEKRPLFLRIGISFWGALNLFATFMVIVNFTNCCNDQQIFTNFPFFLSPV